MANKKKAKKKKKKANGHRIGGAFENKVRLLLTSTFEQFGIVPTDAFRSAKSGGHKDSYGDISISPALAKLFPAAIECKHWARIDLYQLLQPWNKMGKVNKFKEWWSQTLSGAAKSKNLYPLLVFRSKGQHIYCMLYAHHFYPMVNVKANFFRKKKIAVIKSFHPDGELLCFKFDVLLKLLVKRAKKQSRYIIHASQGQGDIVIDSKKTLQEALDYVEQNKGSASFGIELPDKSWYKWPKKGTKADGAKQGISFRSFASDTQSSRPL